MLPTKIAVSSFMGKEVETKVVKRKAFRNVGRGGVTQLLTYKKTTTKNNYISETKKHLSHYKEFSSKEIINSINTFLQTLHKFCCA